VTPTVTAVMLAYGAEPYLVDAVHAALASTGVEIEVVLVDNGCTSDAVHQVKDLDRVRVLTPSENTGYSGGCLIGAAEARGTYLAFVNSDAIVAPEAIARLVAVAGEPSVGLAMGSIRLAPEPEVINTSGNPMHYVGLVWTGGYGEPASAHSERRHVPIASGCCFAMRRALWEDMGGGFAREYFAYHEDTELSLRLWHRGLDLEYVPDAVVLHHYEFSRTAFKQYLLERNRLALLLTTYQTRSLVLLAPMLLLAEAALFTAAVLGRWPGAKLRGYGWLWRNRKWVRARRVQLQRERVVPDRELARRLLSSQVDPANVSAPPGTPIFNLIASTYWRLVRPLL
jgi:GT2 family glycosyltransferase